MNKSIAYAMIDGIIQGMLLELLLNYITSTIWSYSIIGITGAVAFIALSAVSTVFLLIKAPNKSWKNYLMSSMFFIAMGVILFINKITLKIRLFPVPQREMNDAEGIIIIIAIILFLVLLVIERTLGLIWQQKKTHSTGDGLKPLKEKTGDGQRE